VSVIFLNRIAAVFLWNYWCFGSEDKTCVFFFSKTPPRQLVTLDLNNSILNNSPGTPLTRSRKALLLATNHQEIHLTSIPGSPLTRAKKKLLLGT
jgi:hypothetical protein